MKGRKSKLKFYIGGWLKNAATNGSIHCRQTTKVELHSRQTTKGGFPARPTTKLHSLPRLSHNVE